jgi:hypothetical protein
LVEEFLKQENRAQDILLGSLGIGEDAVIVSLELTRDGYRGVAKWPDGETFSFESEDPLDELQSWALEVLRPLASPSKKSA